MANAEFENNVSKMELFEKSGQLVKNAVETNAQDSIFARWNNLLEKELQSAFPDEKYTLGEVRLKTVNVKDLRKQLLVTREDDKVEMTRADAIALAREAIFKNNPVENPNIIWTRKKITHNYIYSPGIPAFIFEKVCRDASHDWGKIRIVGDRTVAVMRAVTALRVRCAVIFADRIEDFLINKSNGREEVYNIYKSVFEGRIRLKLPLPIKVGSRPRLIFHSNTPIPQAQEFPHSLSGLPPVWDERQGMFVWADSKDDPRIEATEKMQNGDCRHRWLVKPPKGESAEACCKYCSETKNFINFELPSSQKENTNTETLPVRSPSPED